MLYLPKWWAKTVWIMPVHAEARTANSPMNSETTQQLIQLGSFPESGDQARLTLSGEEWERRGGAWDNHRSARQWAERLSTVFRFISNRMMTSVPLLCMFFVSSCSDEFLKYDFVIYLAYWCYFGVRGRSMSHAFHIQAGRVPSLSFLFT